MLGEISDHIYSISDHECLYEIQQGQLKTSINYISDH